MRCWICGSEGTTGEHLTKASDLRSEFGNVSQKSPIFLHRENAKNIRINSIKKSREIKCKALLCPNCNNARTAPFDRAWEQLSLYLRKRRNGLKKGDLIRLDRVFPGGVKRSMLSVYLYFIKIFGCLIRENKMPIGLNSFRRAILCNEPHPYIYLTFWGDTGIGTGISDVHIELSGNKCVYATWFYGIGTLVVNIMYAIPGQRRNGLIGAWHPTNIQKRIRVFGI